MHEAHVRKGANRRQARLDVAAKLLPRGPLEPLRRILLEKMALKFAPNDGSNFKNVRPNL